MSLTSVLSQVSAPNRVGLQQHRSVVVQNDEAVLQHVTTMDNGQRHRGVLLDYQDGHALVVDGLNDVEYLID